jgi:integrase
MPDPAPLHAYVVRSLATGIRTEEAHALRWDHVVAWSDHEDWQPVTEAGFDHDRFAVHVWRSVRARGDTNTQRSRRTLELPHEAANALRDHHERQTEQRIDAGQLRHDTGLVFTTNVGTALDTANVRRSFKAITTAAKVGENWTPHETRHTFVSIMSDNDVSLEKVADLVGQKGTTNWHLRWELPQ